MVDAVLEFPDYPQVILPVSFVVDTGAARTMVGPADVGRLEQLVGVPATSIGVSDYVFGVGGIREGRTVRCVLTMRTDARPPWSRAIDLFLMPEDEESTGSFEASLLGREILYELPLFVDFKAKRVLLHAETVS
jgi:hypothetical protein